MSTIINQEYYSIHISRYQQILKIITNLNLPKNTNVLDIGCYPPHIFNSLKTMGFHPYGISSQHEIVENKDIHICNIEKESFPFTNNYFKFVLFSEVLEHLTVHPQNIFQEINRVLLPDGYFLITTPNAVRSQNLIKLILGQNIYFDSNQLKENIYHRHNREYVLSELQQMITNSDLKIIKSGHFISYSPFRQKNKHDSLGLKIIKQINYLFMLIFPTRQDTLYILAQKINH